MESLGTGPRLLTHRSRAEQLSRGFMSRPGVVHVKETVARFGLRLGNQFAAAITYFLVLAIIPTAMFAFAATGFVLDVVRPELVDVVSAMIEEAVPGNPELVSMFEGFLTNWAGVGLVSLVAALYTAQGFIGNLKDAIRAQLRGDFDSPVKDPLVRKYLNNLVTLVGIVAGIGFTVAATIIGTGLQTQIVGWLGLPGWVTPVLTITPMFITLGASWLVFWFIFTMIPSTPIPRRTRAIGSFIGAFALTVLLNLATVVIGAFSGSPTAALFGPIIAVMAAMNLFARILLVIAAWMGTADDDTAFAHIAEAPAGYRPPARGRRAPVTTGSRGEALGGFLVASGLIALTILGYRSLEARGAVRAADSTDGD
ncbi:YhjD/YihY/BrkB family envelope integrity protein [Brevibacterium samyangense]|uniref:Inner membrane protein YhjD n=1 Tax=Brevibacterium samyangense TaxID=366888 RepID=A0ABN2TE47_9MICO